MTESGTNGQRFLTAFHAIETILARQQERNFKHGDWPGFIELLNDSDTLLRHQKDRLRAFAKLRNAISHEGYLDGKPIADPREDVIADIEKILHALLEPPLLVSALDDRDEPAIFRPADSLAQFLELVTEHNFSQAPVQTDKGFLLITTNAVARWYARQLKHGGEIKPEVALADVLKFSETGDRLQTVNPTTTVVQAINRFSGETDASVEPPAALLVLGKMGQNPQRLVSRADLSLLYASLDS